MTRLLILVALVVGVLWWLFGRKRVDSDAADPSSKPNQRTDASAKPQTKTKPKPLAQIVACAHCGVHLPREETVVDADGQLFCGEAHRLAGPR